MDGTGRSWIVLEIDSARCHVCAPCQAKAVCRGRAIRMIDRGEAPFIDSTRCWGCLTCVASCPFDAVVRHDLRRDRP